MKRRSISSSSTSSSECVHHFVIRVTADILMPVVQLIAAPVAKSIVSLDVFAGTRLQVLDHRQFYPGTDGLAGLLLIRRIIIRDYHSIYCFFFIVTGLNSAFALGDSCTFRSYWRGGGGLIRMTAIF